MSQLIRKDFLKIFEKAIHITATDLSETFVIRNIASLFDEIKAGVVNGNYDFRYFDEISKRLQTLST